MIHLQELLVWYCGAPDVSSPKPVRTGLSGDTPTLTDSGRNEIGKSVFELCLKNKGRQFLERH